MPYLLEKMFLKRSAKKLFEAFLGGMKRFLEYAVVRENCSYLTFQDTIDRLKNLNVNECDKQIL